jgi:NAD dependent epimerase/dehydratase
VNKVLVTGADGFIGSHLVEMLVHEGYQVRALCLYNSFGSWGWLDTISDDVKAQIEVVLGDIRDPHAMNLAVQDCDTVFHLAALIAIPYSYRAPASYVDTNVHGTLNLLQAAHAAGVKRFIQTSTSEVYGTAQHVPISEAHPLNAQSPYAATKVASDQMAVAFSRSFGLPVIVVRPFNTYGPRQSTRAVIPTIITQLLDGAQSIRLGSISPTRDFSHVTDTCAGFVAAERCDLGRATGRVVNLGANFEISIGDTARVIAEVVGVDLKIDTDEARLRPGESEVERLWADNSLAADILGWRPRYGALAGFHEGIAETVAWFRNPANRALYKSGLYAT